MPLMRFLNNRHSRVNITSFIQFLAVFVLIFFSHDTVMFGQSSNNLLVSIGKIVPTVVVALLIVSNFSKPFKIKNIVAFFLLVFFQIVSCLIHNESLNNYLFVASVISASFLYISFYSFEVFKRRYLQVLLFLSIFSLATWVVASTFPSIVQFFPKTTNSNGIVFHNLLFSLVDFNSKSNLIRNASIFREPGVYVIYLIIALIFCLREKKTKASHLLIFIASVITTFSTAGYIVLLLLLLYFWAFKANKRLKIPFFFGAFVLIIILYFSTDLLSANGPLFVKFDATSNRYGSYFARIQSVRFNLQVFGSNPIFGIGRYGLYDYKVLGVEGINNRFIAVHNTNTILIGFASYGLFYGLLISIGLFMFCLNSSRNWFSALFLFAILFLLLSNEDITQNSLFYILIFDGLFNYKNNESKQTICALSRTFYAAR